MANSPSGLNNMSPQFQMMVDILRDSMVMDFGKQGAIFINDNAAKTGPFYAIQGISNCELDFTSGGTVGSGMTDFDVDFTVPNGAIIYGNFTTVKTVTSTACECIAYKK
jgi:hypothetical protein